MQSSPEAVLKTAVHRDTHRVPRPKGLWLNRVCHPTWVLDYCGGEGVFCRLEQDGREGLPFRWQPGAWHLYAPGVPYRLRFDRPGSMAEDMWLRFEWPRPPAPLRRAFAVIEDAEELLAGDVRALCEIQDRGIPGGDLAVRGLLLSALGKILIAAHAGSAGTPEEPWRVVSPKTLEAESRERLLHRVDLLVGRSLARPPALPQLAAQLNMSVSSLAHRFKKEAGLTVVQRIRWLRIREAKRLLARPSATVKSVAGTLGFPNPFYFSRVFTRVAGLTPVLYRRRYHRLAAY